MQRLALLFAILATATVLFAAAQPKRSEYVTVIISQREAWELLRQCSSNYSCSQEVMAALQKALGQPATGISEDEQEQSGQSSQHDENNYGDPRRPIQGQPDKP